jgi:F-type H+-transporting ATPase subunit a
MESFFRLKRTISPIESDTVFNFFGYPINNSTTTLFLIILLLIVVAVILYKKSKVIPSTFQSVLELFYESVLKIVTQITGNSKVALGIFPLIGTLFVFIFLANFMGLVPVLTSFSFNGVSIFRTATSDFNTTFSIAVAMILFLQFVNIKETSILAYIGKFFQFKEVYLGFRKGMGEGAIAVLNFFIGLLDIVSECAKIISLSLRLFGNMFAGDVLATVIIGGIAYGLPALWMSMSMLSAVVQTMVFSFLITAYYTMSLSARTLKGEEAK